MTAKPIGQIQVHIKIENKIRMPPVYTGVRMLEDPRNIATFTRGSTDATLR